MYRIDSGKKSEILKYMYVRKATHNFTQILIRVCNLESTVFHAINLIGLPVFRFNKWQISHESFAK